MQERGEAWAYRGLAVGELGFAAARGLQQRRRVCQSRLGLRQLCPFFRGSGKLGQLCLARRKRIALHTRILGVAQASLAVLQGLAPDAPRAVDFVAQRAETAERIEQLALDSGAGE